jgi:hypothetical protein
MWRIQKEQFASFFLVSSEQNGITFTMQRTEIAIAKVPNRENYFLLKSYKLLIPVSILWL